MKQVRILVADDHALLRHGLKVLLESQLGWKVEAEASDGWQVVSKAKAHLPDILVLDISMPGLNGLDAAALVKKESPSTRVLMLTMHDSEELIEQCLRAGAMGYVLKSDAERDVIAAVRALLEGRPFFTSAPGKVILRKFQRANSEKYPKSAPALSDRERQIVQLLAEGRSNKEIASALHLSVRTVETHRANIMKKLDLQSVSDLVRYAIRNNIVQA
jgi:DNA-binding NarL/FixJ family response regulator